MSWRCCCVKRARRTSRWPGSSTFFPGPTDSTPSSRRGSRRPRDLLGAAPASFAFDIGGLDDRPPFLDLGLVGGGERLGRLLLRRRDILAELHEPLLHRRV